MSSSFNDYIIDKFRFIYFELDEKTINGILKLIKNEDFKNKKIEYEIELHNLGEIDCDAMIDDELIENILINSEGAVQLELTEDDIGWLNPLLEMKFSVIIDYDKVSIKVSDFSDEEFIVYFTTPLPIELLESVKYGI